MDSTRPLLHILHFNLISGENANLLKTKRNLLYIRISSYRAVNTSYHDYKNNQLMMYIAKVAVCSDIRTKHSTQSERHVEFLNVKPGGTESDR